MQLNNYYAQINELFKTNMTWQHVHVIIGIIN